MKIRLALLSTILLAAVAVAPAQSPLINYQGRLMDSGQRANGIYDLAFALRDAETNGNRIGAQLNVAPVGVTNGLFTVTLDFGVGAIDGRALWLEIGVRTNGDVSAYKLLSPLEPLTSVPSAIVAGNAKYAGMATNLVPGTLIAGNGAGITNLSGANLAAGSVTSNQIATATDIAYRAGATLPLIFTTPQQFGAKGDGITDDTVALQNWLTDASVNHKTAVLPPATGLFYKITSELTVSNGLHLSGGGGGKHTTSGYGYYMTRCMIRQFTPGQNGLHLYSAVDSIHIDNVAICANSPTDYTNNGCGIFFDGGSPDSDCTVLDQVLVTGFGTGVNAASVADTSIRACSFGYNRNGISISGVANNVTLESCQLSYNLGHQVLALAADNLILQGCDIASLTPESQGVYCENNVGLIMIGCRFEDYSTNTMLIMTTTGAHWGPELTLVGTRFYNFTHSVRYSMALTNVYTATLINVLLEGVAGDGFSMVSSGLDPNTHAYAVPAQTYRYIYGLTSQSRTATMIDPNLHLTTANDSTGVAKVASAPGKGYEVSGPTGLTTNLVFRPGMELSISNGVVMQVR